MRAPLRRLVPALALAGSAGLNTMPAAHAQDRAQLMQQHRGGTMRLLASSSAGTVDPQINYEGEFWQVYANVYDGLTAFKKVVGPDGNTIVPDLAENVPQPQEGGRTFVFKLRPGIKFANGHDVTAVDVVASFQRIFKISGPTSGSFYGVIVGADRCLKSPADCTLEGGVVADAEAGTVTFHLTAPDEDFLDMLASTVRAGLALSSALLQAVDVTFGALENELRSALAEIGLGRERSAALRSMAERINEPQLSTAVTAIVQAEKLGANVSAVLHELAVDSRHHRWTVAEERAARLPIQMLIPMALLMIPSLYVMIFGPIVANILMKR